MSSIHSKVGGSIETHSIPLSVVNRPIPSVLDPLKVDQFAEDLKADADFPPIDVLEIEHKGKMYYYAFGGCHRWAAHKKVGKQVIKANIIPTPKSTLDFYLGGSNPFKE